MPLPALVGVPRPAFSIAEYLAGDPGPKSPRS
jgi:hypothetical protein